MTLTQFTKRINKLCNKEYTEKEIKRILNNFIKEEEPKFHKLLIKRIVKDYKKNKIRQIS